MTARRHPARLVATLAGCCAALLCASAHAADATVQKVTVRAVAHFGFDATSLSAADQGRLLAEVGAMQGVTWQTVTATGHTDSVGSAGYNDALSQRRAAAVRSYLLAKGLPAALVRTAARGEAVPVASNETDDGRAENRRTEVVFEGVRAP